MTASRLNSCRGCHGRTLEPVLSLGETPLVNALVVPAQIESPEPRYPLTLVSCPECSLVQILESVPAETLFREYPYFSSYSDTLLAHADALAERLCTRRGFGADHLVLEVASNDGYLLGRFAERGVGVLGVEPAQNVAEVARGRGINTLGKFFNAALAEELRRGGVRPDVVFANNVLAHAEDLDDFVCGIATLLEGEATAEIEVPYVCDLIDKCEFDTIYHEHRCYFSLTALLPLFERHGLCVSEVERISLHGGSLHLSISPSGVRPIGRSVTERLAWESDWGVASIKPYRAFARRVEVVKASLVALLDGLKADGRRVAAYGAAAKGVVLLNYCGLGSEHLDYVVDRNPNKQGFLMPGSRLPIESPERLLSDPPDDLLILTWNFAEEIMRQQSVYRKRGGRFLIPIPKPHVVVASEELHATASATGEAWR